MLVLLSTDSISIESHKNNITVWCRTFKTDFWLTTDGPMVHIVIQLISTTFVSVIAGRPNVGTLSQALWFEFGQFETFESIKVTNIYILLVLYSIPCCFNHFHHLVHFLHHLSWLRIADEGSTPEANVWSMCIYPVLKRCNSVDASNNWFVLCTIRLCKNRLNLKANKGQNNLFQWVTFLCRWHKN